MNTNKLFFMLCMSISLAGCIKDDVKNTYTISGTIGSDIGNIVYDPIGFPFFIINKYFITLLSGDQVISSAIASDTNAVFKFSELEEGKSYTIQIESEEFKSGPTAIDFVELRKYLEGLIVLDPFQKLAADVNRDNIINQEDLDLLMNCLLGGTCFGARFASPDYDGIGTGYTDPYTISNLMSDIELTFKPIKIGDVNRSN